MLDWIKSWFGKGRVRLEFQGIDRTGNIVTGDGRVPYVGRYTEQDVIAYFKRELMYKHGVSATQVTIVQHIEE
jgi:hypothetical protein